MSEQVTTRKTIFQLLFRLLFIVAPSLFVFYLTLKQFDRQYTYLDIGALKQAVYLGAGLTAAYVLYFYRARFIITFPILLLIYWLIGRFISRLPGEIDVFQYAVEFKLYSTLFILGWIFGFLLVRMKYAYIIIGGVMAVVSMVALASESNLTSDLTFGELAFSLLPVVAYVLYMLFIAPPLSESIDIDWKRSGKSFGKALVLLGLILVTFFIVRDRFDKEFEVPDNLKVDENDSIEKEGKGGKKKGYNQRDGLLERGNKGNKGDKEGKGGKGGKEPGDGKDGNKPDDGEDGYKPKDTMKMSDKLSQADYIMFCAKVKNYFPDGTPKPLYFVYHYLTKYDPEKESFIRDTAMPHYDELKVDPSALPMYRSKTDSSVIKNTLATKKMSVITSEVYVSSNTWKHALLAPASAFYCQTIPVDSSYKKMFRSAYKVKSYTSELNNAYFVYNPSGSPQLEAYQEERYNELRTVKNYAGTDTALFRYYTQMPKGPLYDSIMALSKRLTQGAMTPIDKVIAIRDFFLQTDKEGNKIFRYTLTPGVASDPNIPNASMLRNFIFKTHAGYCTYYAGASLFLLRSAGIPSRFTTGFATIDRSDKNKGWYWFYASQAHAWTQVYFPGYGWLDFDMTIGNDEQREAPNPDGTPPLPPPEPWLVVDGKAESAPDLKTKRLEVSFARVIFFNDDYRLEDAIARTIDASVCRVLYGKKDTTLSCIRAGDSLVIVSYDDAAKQVPVPDNSKSIEEQIAGFPKPIIADEIHIKVRKEDRKKEEEKKKEANKAEEKGLTWGQIFIRVGIIVGGLIILLFLIPAFWLLWLLLRFNSAKSTKSKADTAYRLALYHFHMAGVERESETPLQYATAKADPVFKNGFGAFMNVFLRLKYANGQVMTGDDQLIRTFGKSIRPAARNKAGFFKMIANYFNIFRAQRFFRRPEETTIQEQQSSL
ncbi:MAG: transglutaminase-like domain-containing protein [Bacteroidota bacterium]|nr:transglutaminase-like domain-containing protein [Bacteroidota bacterium]